MSEKEKQELEQRDSFIAFQAESLSVDTKQLLDSIIVGIIDYQLNIVERPPLRLMQLIVSKHMLLEQGIDSLEKIENRAEQLRKAFNSINDGK